MSYRELQEAIEYMKERRSDLRISRVREKVVVLKDRISEMEKEKQRRRHEEAHGGKVE